jgi:excisionase family DNA binding protein
MATSEVQVPKLLTVAELAKRTGISKWRWYELIPQGKAPPYLRVGKTFRFAEDAVVKWIAEQSNQEGDLR